MGRGDQRTKRGKIFRGTAGRTRPNPKQKKRAKAVKKANRKSKQPEADRTETNRQDAEVA